jgi:hypothetical protein
MKKQLLIASLSLFLLSSCTKKIDFLPGSGPGNGSGGQSGKTIDGLAGTSWKISGSVSTVDYGSGLVVDFDLFALYPGCNLDDIHTFNTNGTITDDAGATKCSSSDPQSIVSGDWKLSADKKTLSFSTTIPNVVGLTKLDAEVLELSENKFRIRYTTYYNGPKAVTTTSYTRAK